MVIAVLNTLKDSVAGVLGAALLTREGIVLASRLPAEMSEDALGLLGASLHAVGADGAAALALAGLDWVQVCTGHGSLFVIQAQNDLLLLVLTRPDEDWEQAAAIATAAARLVQGVPAEAMRLPFR